MGKARVRITQANDLYNIAVTNLLEELGRYDDAMLNKKATDGGWSATQTAHHLLMSEELSYAYVQKKLGFAKEGKADFKRANWKSRWRYIKIWLVFTLPLKFKAPANLDTEKLPDYASFAQTRERWTNIRNQWNEFLNHLPDTLANQAVFRHQLVGKMSWTDMCRFYSIHLNRHLKQIRKALSN